MSPNDARRDPVEGGPATHPTVVGIGASAGGLAALKELFATVPAGTGLAWVVVVHLSPSHESHLAELLQPYVSLPVHQVNETVLLEPDHVYVIPPNANLNAVDTHLRLSALETQVGLRMPADHFFRTLSATHNGRAVGVVLTGTGSDGSLGLRDIKEKGGIAVAQSPEEAEYDAMPRNAIATGVVDLVLPLSEIAGAVVRYSRTEPRVEVPEEGEDTGPAENRLLRKIFAHLRARTARDFSRYKRSTIVRRITRRMQLRQIEELEDYLDLLRDDGDEVHALADDLLVVVTSFFRDPGVFDALERHVIPRLFDAKGPEDEIRVWCVGCATGEEAYSLAMLFLEEAGRRDEPPALRIFASDLHERSLARAREGFYRGDIEGDVHAGRLRRFFQKEEGGYRIRHDVRETLIFSPHNVLSDPPFSRLDLVTCRNLLIYLDADVQNDVLALFHYALNPDGFLALGTSERAGDELFRAEDKEHGIYERRNVPGPEPNLPVFPLTRRGLPGRAGHSRPTVRSTSYCGVHQRTLERYAPPSLLVNAEGRAVHLSERAGRFLSHPGGDLTARAAKLLREELRVEFRSALREVRERREPVRTRPVEVQLEGELRLVTLDLRPSSGPEDPDFVLVLFDERAPAAPRASEGGDGPPTPAGSGQDDRVRALETELSVAQQSLESIIERYEANRDTINAANEELQSANEELRSTMEELETSKEELQSMNEELQMVNQENRHKVDELAQLSSDLQNLLTSTDIATLFLDRELRILRFTPGVTSLFYVRSVDRGRRVSELRHRLDYDELPDDAARVLEGLVPLEREVRHDEGRWYLARVLPYRSVEERIEGVVMTFVDITARKEAQQEIERAKMFAESIVDSLQGPLLVLDSTLRVVAANPSFHASFGTRPAETIGRLVYELGDAVWNVPELRELLEGVSRDRKAFWDFEVRHGRVGMPEQVLLLDGRRLDHVDLVLLAMRDVTELKRKEEALQLAKGEAEDASRGKSRLIATMSHELRTPLMAVSGLATLLESEMAGPINAKQKGHASRIKRSVVQLVRIIDDALRASRLEISEGEAELTDVDLAQITREVVSLMEGAAQAEARTLEVRGTENPVRATTDGGKVAQILTNLISNALKYSSESPVDIALTTDGTWAEIRVRDLGPGIPADRHEVIFAPFVRGRHASDQQQAGAGLGLTIARNFARLLGGDLTVDSEQGEGTTFTLRLPVQPQVALTA